MRMVSKGIFIFVLILLLVFAYFRYPGFLEKYWGIAVLFIIIYFIFAYFITKYQEARGWEE